MMRTMIPMKQTPVPTKSQVPMASAGHDVAGADVDDEGGEEMVVEIRLQLRKRPRNDRWGNVSPRSQVNVSFSRMR